MLQLTVLIVIAYLLGSIPTSILVVKGIKRVDIRDYGSGNAGGTNVGRVLGWKWAVLVILVDALKGWLAAAVLPLFFPGTPLAADPGFSSVIAGVAAMLGHVFPLFAGFRGGKGVATAAGIAIGVSQPYWVILAALGLFGIVLLSTRYMFLASISGGIAYAVLIHFFAAAEAVSLRIFAIACALLLIILHYRNIGRWRRGVENRISRKLTPVRPAIEDEPQTGAEDE